MADPDLNTAIRETEPTSYWPLSDTIGTMCRDEMGLHDAVVNGTGVKLAAIPFGAVSVPYFDGEIGSVLTVADDPQYSQPVRRHTRPSHRKARPSPNLIVALECHPHSKGAADQSSA